MNKKKAILIIIVTGIVMLLTIVLVVKNKEIYYAYGNYDAKNFPSFPTNIKEYDKLTYENGKEAKVILRKKGNTKGVCFIDDDSLICFDSNNYKYENKHVQEVFGSNNCEVGKMMTICNNNTFYCYIESDGYVECEDDFNAKYCNILPDGATSCGDYE